MRGETGLLTLVIFNCDYVGLVNVVLLVTWYGECGIIGDLVW